MGPQDDQLSRLGLYKTLHVQSVQVPGGSRINDAYPPKVVLDRSWPRELLHMKENTIEEIM